MDMTWLSQKVGTIITDQSEACVCANFGRLWQYSDVRGWVVGGQCDVGTVASTL